MDDSSRVRKHTAQPAPRAIQTAAHLVDRVIPPVPVRQWVISLPKRLRWFLADRPEAGTALTIVFLDEIERLLWVEFRSACDAIIVAG